MYYIADLHIHSPFSRATSPDSSFTGLATWAKIKGIQVIGTGDFTHPGWMELISKELEPAEPGFFKLRNESHNKSLLGDTTVPEGIVRFILSAEISCIYKRHGKVRKVHNLLYVPDLESARKINTELAGIGNLKSDGRPILGLDSRNLLEILLKHSPDGFLVPAHIWTPWFSLFGSRSGFDDIEECFGDLTDQIFALETGLSSDPDMNRLISKLDRFTLISNSDCHSPSKMGREANLFSTGFDYFSLRDALKKNSRTSFLGTVEFFPEEGKYHFDGHRSCQVCLDPKESQRIKDLLCPVCNKPLTIGVMHRVTDLADRATPQFKPDSPDAFSLVPLPEVLGEILGVGPTSKRVAQHYAHAIHAFGSEFNLMLKADHDQINHYSSILATAIKRIRNKDVIRLAGYDGEFGQIGVFDKIELAGLKDSKPQLP